MQKGAIIGTDYLNGVCGDIDIGNGVTINIHNNGYMAAMGKYCYLFRGKGKC